MSSTTKVEASMRHRKKRPHSALKLLVTGKDGSVPHPSPHGVQVAREWLEEEFEELKVSLAEPGV